MIGYKTLGRGPEKVIALHDWFCDASEYDPILDYLDLERFTFCFVDLRGYGRSKHLIGACTVEEAAEDIVALMDHLKWDRVNVMGHSMSGMIGQYLLWLIPERIEKFVAITPVPACGSPAPEDVLAFLEEACQKNDETAQQIIHFMTGNRLANAFAAFKVRRWRETSVPEARMAYLHMFTQTDFSDRLKGLSHPVLVITGAQDAEAYQTPRMAETLLSWFSAARLVTINDCGHYPMQETPALLASYVQMFLARD